MVRRTLMQNLTVLAVVALFATSAHAALFSLRQSGVQGDSIAYDALWTQETGDPNSFAVDFHIVVEDTSVAALTAAETNGNPFLLPSLNRTFLGGFPEQVSIGGADLYGPGQSGTIRLGGITVTAVGPGSTNLLDGQYSGTVDEWGTKFAMNTPTILATFDPSALVHPSGPAGDMTKRAILLPEPAALVLMGLGIGGLVFLRRRRA